MASLKEIRGRIGSVKNTLKITSAMRMISSAKLHNAQNAVGNMVVYERNLHEIMMSLKDCPDTARALAPFSRSNGEGGTAVVLVTSNQTLCGAFNANIIKAFEKENFDKGKTLVYAVGKFGLKHASRLGYRTVDCSDMSSHAAYDRSAAVADGFVTDFFEGRLSRVVMVYSHFASAVSQPVCVEDYLPFSLAGAESAEDKAGDMENRYIVEPSAGEVFERLLPQVMRLKMHTVMLDAAAAEHAARTRAMQLASENAEDLIGELSLQYNKMRQQAITSEILDLLGGQANNN